MNELEKAQEKIIQLNDLLKEKDTTIQDLNQFKSNLEEEKTNLNTQVEDLRKTNKNYFERIISQDNEFQKENKVINEKVEIKSSLDWGDIF